MYLQYFGLTCHPFSIATDVNVIYYNEQYRDAYAHLCYSIANPGGIILLTGEVGTGKTTLVRNFLHKQNNQQIQTAFIFNPKQSASQLLNSICREFGIDTDKTDNNNTELIDLLNEFLIETYQKKKSAIIVIDEAQHLDFDSLEQLRLITNLETGEHKLIQIILTGQEELLVTLAQSELRQFTQRIVARFHLRHLNERQLFEYIQHRLAIANGSEAIIPKSLSTLLYKYTKGIPRVANTLCDRALLGAYAKHRARVDKATLHKAAEELCLQYNLQDESALVPVDRPKKLKLTKNSEIPEKHFFFNVTRRHSDIPLLRTIIVVALVMVSSWLLRDLDNNPRTAKLSEHLQLGAENNQEKMEITSMAEEPNKQQTINTTNQTNQQLATPNLEGTNIASTTTEIQVVPPTTPIQKQDTAEIESSAVIPLPEVQATTLIALQSLDDLPNTKNLYTDYSALLELWGVDYTFDLQESPCKLIQQYKLTCAHIKAENTDLIRKINLPTIIEWQGKVNNQTALLVGFDHHSAILLREGSHYTIDNDELTESWQGYGHYFVRAPKDFRTAFKPKSKSDSIIWLLNALTEIDKKYSLNQVSRSYNAQVVRTVKTFQKQHGLTADGIVGFETLALLNHLLYRAPQLEYPE